MKRILEIGPGSNPMHQKHGENLRKLAPNERNLLLEEGEDYTALELPRVAFNHWIWQTAKEAYGDRVHFVHGDGTEMSFEDESFDELVANGSFVGDEKTFAEFHRVLKQGGILRLGTKAQNAQRVVHDWAYRLGKMGFTMVDELTHRYRYTHNKGVIANLRGTDYVVLVFRKES
ncbi:MAG: methyltransferase domain-containing protein [Candidatus Gracilibacteria bacterium]|jgi:SAM-dependent methyltransferase